MRILHVISSVDPEKGGPIEGLVRSAVAMGDLGHETEVVALDAPAAHYLAAFPFPVHALGPVPARYGYTPRLADWIAANAERFDAAVVHGLWNHGSVGGWQGARRAALPYVVFTHGMMDPWFRKAYPIKHWAKQLFWLVAQGWVLRDAFAVLFTTQEERRLARGAFWGPAYKGKVVAFGTADAPEAPASQKAAFLACLPRLAGRRYLLFLSRIHPKKGCDLLIAAFASLAGAYPDYDLVMAGPDQVGDRAALERDAERLGIADRVHWPGMLSGDAKWGAYRSAEAFVLPSHQENFGIVVAEAMACSTPVLITDKVNIWQEVEASGGGLVDSDDLPGATRLLRAWLDLGEAERQGMRLKAREGFLAHFHVDRAAKELGGVLEEAMGSRR